MEKSKEVGKWRRELMLSQIHAAHCNFDTPAATEMILNSKCNFHNTGSCIKFAVLKTYFSSLQYHGYNYHLCKLSS